MSDVADAAPEMDGGEEFGDDIEVESEEESDYEDEPSEYSDADSDIEESGEEDPPAELPFGLIEEDPEPPPPPKTGLLSEAELESFSDRTVKVKIDGEEAEIPLKKVIQGFRKSAAAEKRFQEAAEFRKEAAAQIEQYEDKLGKYQSVLERLFDPDQLFEQYEALGRGDVLKQAFHRFIRDEVEDAQMTPEQRELKALKRERDREKRRYEQWQKQQAAKAEEAEMEKTRAQFNGWVVDAYKEHKIPTGTSYDSAIKAALASQVKEILRAERRAVTSGDVSRILGKIARAYRPVLVAAAKKKGEAQKALPKGAPTKKTAPPPKVVRPGSAPKTASSKAPPKSKKIPLRDYFAALQDVEE